MGAILHRGPHPGASRAFSSHKIGVIIPTPRPIASLSNANCDPEGHHIVAVLYMAYVNEGSSAIGRDRIAGAQCLAEIGAEVIPHGRHV